MARLIFYGIVLALFGLYSSAQAANTINWTFYGPGANGKMQGPMTASNKDAEGSANGIHTLDDVRTGKSKYVTLASANVMKGRYYCIGTVTYTSPPSNGGDGKTHTLENVIGYVHDTGCAFNGTCSCAFLKQFCDGKPRTDKMDIAVGNFSGYSAEYAMNYITKNPNRAPATWTQIAGIPAQGSPQNPLTPCGGQAKEQGTPVAATYTPPPTFAPQNPLQSTVPYGGSPAPQPVPQSYPQSQYQSQSVPPGGAAQGTGVTVVGQPYAAPSYYGSPIPTSNTPAPTVPQSPILTSLFQQSSATSGIRVVQNTAQAIVDLFTAPSIPSSKSGGSAITSNPVPGVVYDDSVSLMLVSQFNDAGSQAADSMEIPVPNVPVGIAQAVQRESTFATQSGLQREVSYNPATASMFLSIISSFRTLFESMVQFFSRS